MGILSVANCATQPEMDVHGQMDEGINAASARAGAIGQLCKWLAGVMRGDCDPGYSSGADTDGLRLRVDPLAHTSLRCATYALRRDQCSGDNQNPRAERDVNERGAIRITRRHERVL